MGQFYAGATFGTCNIAFACVVGEKDGVLFFGAWLGIAAAVGVFISERDRRQRFWLADSGEHPGALPLALADDADGFVELAAIAVCERHAGFCGGGVSVGLRERGAEYVKLAADFGRAAFACGD